MKQFLFQICLLKLALLSLELLSLMLRWCDADMRSESSHSFCFSSLWRSVCISYLRTHPSLILLSRVLGEAGRRVQPD